MHIEEIRQQAYAMPYGLPAYPQGPLHFVQSEVFIVRYRSDSAYLNVLVPEPLAVDSDVVHFQFMRLPLSNGLSPYHAVSQVIVVRDAEGRTAHYTHAVYMDHPTAIAMGRERFGLPAKWAKSNLQLCVDSLVGTLDYESVKVAIGTMGYRYKALDLQALAQEMGATPHYQLKIIPNAAGGGAGVCELVRCFMQDIVLKEAWEGPAGLQLFAHALAPIANLPVLEVLDARHLIADWTLNGTEIAFDYLAN